MKDGDAIVIRKVGNGFLVDTLGDPRETRPCDDIQVFNDMGAFGGNRDDSTVPSLLQFIERHFRDKP